MIGNRQRFQALIGAVLVVLVEIAGIAAITGAFSLPAQAQRLDDRYPFIRRQPRSGGGFFQNFFGGFQTRPYQSEPWQENRPPPPRAEPHYDASRAPPPPRKPEPNGEQVAPTTTIVVMGDGMADWLGYGLEEAFSDTPTVAVVRKDHNHSGLLRYDPKNDLDWWHVVRDILNQEKANYVVMMLGVSDRQNIRERDLAKEAEKNKADEDKAKGDADKNAAADKKADNPDESIIKSEPTGKRHNGVIEFRTDKWAEIYSRRIDATIAALKSKGVPVIWVGLPAIRGARSTADAGYLNDLYRARAERAGVDYVDVWDGFVDEAGKYSSYGPDYEGQTRRLRSNDGVYFTKAGARKLAHYVEREIRRYMANHAVPVALPSGPVAPSANEAKSTERPLAGPVVPLTTLSTNSDELLGAANSHLSHSDAIAARVLVRGEPLAAPPGRADDFAWPPGSDAMAAAKAKAPAKPAAKPKKQEPAPAAAAAPVPVAGIQPERESIEPAKAAAAKPAGSAKAPATKPVEPAHPAVIKPAESGKAALAKPGEPAAASGKAAVTKPAERAKPVARKPVAEPKKKETDVKLSQEAPLKPRMVRPRESRSQDDDAPRPPALIPSSPDRPSSNGSGGLFDWLH